MPLGARRFRSGSSVVFLSFVCVLPGYFARRRISDAIWPKAPEISEEC
jgi:hypothetical protein